MFSELRKKLKKYKSVIMKKMKLIYEAPSTKEVLLRLEHRFMQGSPYNNDGPVGDPPIDGYDDLD